MDFQNSVKKAIDIIKLDEKAIGQVSKDKEAWKMGLLIIAIGGILSGLASYIMTKTSSPVLNMMGLGKLGEVAQKATLSSIILAPIGSIIGTLIIVGIFLLIAKLFKGKGTYMELFTPIAFATILSWLGILNIIPTIGGIINFLAGIWSIVVMVVIIRKVNVLSTGKAVAVVLIPLAIILIIFMIITALAVALLGAGALSAMNTGLL